MEEKALHVQTKDKGLRKKERRKDNKISIACYPPAGQQACMAVSSAPCFLHRPWSCLTSNWNNRTIVNNEMSGVNRSQPNFESTYTYSAHRNHRKHKSTFIFMRGSVYTINLYSKHWPLIKPLTYQQYSVRYIWTLRSSGWCGTTFLRDQCNNLFRTLHFVILKL